MRGATIVMGSLLAVAASGAASAYGAIAVGNTKNPSDGFAFGASINHPSKAAAIAKALETCRAFQGAPKMQKFCKVVLEFHGGCYSLAFDPDPNSPGIGWATGPDTATSVANALQVCRSKAPPARRQFCETDKTQLGFCDTHD